MKGQKRTLNSSSNILIPCCSYASEAFVYDRLHDKRPQGYSFFPSALAYGKIVCSSIFPSGSILVLSWVEGERLLGQWPGLGDAEKEHIRRECRSAVAIFRELGIWVGDCVHHNILYSQSSREVTMVDFEFIGACSEEHRRILYAPELIAIFGDDVVLDTITGG